MEFNLLNLKWKEHELEMGFRMYGLKKALPIALGCVVVVALSGMAHSAEAPLFITGEQMVWHPVTFTFVGPEASEDGLVNPFRDYRLTVTFTQGEKRYAVPGYFAADGDAANSSATSGNRWRAHFMPDQAGEWNYTVSFLKGRDAALDLEPKNAAPVEFDGMSGSITVEPSHAKGRDFRARGALRYTGGHYLQFAQSGEYFLKGGADSPENFLAYYEFDGTYCHAKNHAHRSGEAAENFGLHQYKPHAGDWNPGDPTWQLNKGKNIIGALNYLASEGMNSVYFLTMNVNGDGKDVWPWTSHTERFRYDCSKLDQWEIVFQHMDRLGLMMHVITQETENDHLLDGGELDKERKLYYRELIARFSHHPALVWNLGEENTNTDKQRKAFAEYIHTLDPYKHPIVIHTYPRQYDRVYTPLLGFEHFHGTSLQMGNQKQVHSETIKWLDRSAQTEQKWVVFLDEIGPASVGVKPDADDPDHFEVRYHSLWGNLMAGGAGCEWYFGYQYAHNDLNCEDWRSRAEMWKQTRIALEFFQNHLPFTEMKHADDLTPAKDDYCFAKEGEVYAIYMPKFSETTLDLDEGTYRVYWCNPRESSKLLYGSTTKVEGGSMVSVGWPPSDLMKDWVVLVKKEQ
jgi:hypothetical protein